MYASSIHCAGAPSASTTFNSKWHFGHMLYSTLLTTRRAIRPCRWSDATASSRQLHTQGQHCQCASRTRCYSSFTSAKKTLDTEQSQNGSVSKFQRRTSVKDIKVSSDSARQSSIQQKIARALHSQGRPDKGVSSIGKTYDVRGWVRTARNQKTFSFIEASPFPYYFDIMCCHGDRQQTAHLHALSLAHVPPKTCTQSSSSRMSRISQTCQLLTVQVNDGTTLAGLQVVVQPDVPGYDLLQSGAINTGAAVRVHGEITESPGKNQKATYLHLVQHCERPHCRNCTGTKQLQHQDIAVMQSSSSGLA